MHFNIRLWGSVQLLEAVQEHYEFLSPYVRSVLPLKRFWGLGSGRGRIACSVYCLNISFPLVMLYRC